MIHTVKCFSVVNEAEVDVFLVPWFFYDPADADNLISDGFPCGSASKESACNSGNLGLIPGLGRSPGEGKGYPLQYSGLETSMDCIVQGLSKSWTWLNDFRFHCIIQKARESQNSIYFCFIDYAKGFDCVDQTNCGKRREGNTRDGNTRPPYLPPEKPVCRSRSNS